MRSREQRCSGAWGALLQLPEELGWAVERLRAGASLQSSESCSCPPRHPKQRGRWKRLVPRRYRAAPCSLAVLSRAPHLDAFLRRVPLPGTGTVPSPRPCHPVPTAMGGMGRGQRDPAANPAPKTALSNHLQALAMETFLIFNNKSTAKPLCACVAGAGGAARRARPPLPLLPAVGSRQTPGLCSTPIAV